MDYNARYYQSYQLGQWAEAKSDFERVLAFPAEQALFSDERDLAEKYLAELNSKGLG